MILLAHRGLWKVKDEQNTLEAYRAAFVRGYGVELDVRDAGGELVISHDLPTGPCLSFQAVLDLHADFPPGPVIAINIKADGLTSRLAEMLHLRPSTPYFCFDMSVPDALHYVRAGLCAFTRHSEYEADPSFYREAHGIWLDRFVDPWVDPAEIVSQLRRGKKVAVVSPELHRKPHTLAWSLWREALRASDLPAALIDQHLMLCTDFPDEAHAFFNQDRAGDQ